jgi:divinyl protochlorophyllide a 8-vinyl-reductase
MAQASVGPNAILRVCEALSDRIGAERTASALAPAGLHRYLAEAPTAMVPEDDVAQLQALVRSTLDADGARAVLRDAGRRTGDYLLANRIPRPVQAVLKRLPAPLAARLLAGAIGRHAWTFAGSGRFSSRAGRGYEFRIEGCPLCRRLEAQQPACDYYAATFERLFTELVRADARVVETACQARGDRACVFAVRW